MITNVCIYRYIYILYTYVMNHLLTSRIEYDGSKKGSHHRSPSLFIMDAGDVGLVLVLGHITPTKLEHANKPCLLEDKINLTSVFMCDQQPNRMQITQTILGIMIHWFDMYSQFKVSLV